MFSGHTQDEAALEGRMLFERKFGEMQAAVHRLAQKNGFWPEDQNIGEKVALIHSELSEFLEERRTPKSPAVETSKVNQGDELADVVIRVMDLAEHLGINLGRAITFKHEYNLTRPYKHGKAF